MPFTLWWIAPVANWLMTDTLGGRYEEVFDLGPGLGERKPPAQAWGLNIKRRPPRCNPSTMLRAGLGGKPGFAALPPSHKAMADKTPWQAG